MAVVNRTTLKSYFELGDMPSEQQFANLIDSVFIKNEDEIDYDDLSAAVKALISNSSSPNKHWYDTTGCIVRADMYKLVPTDLVLINTGLKIEATPLQNVTLLGKTFYKKGVMQVAGDVLLQNCDAEINGDLHLGGIMYLQGNSLVTGTGLIF